MTWWMENRGWKSIVSRRGAAPLHAFGLALAACSAPTEGAGQSAKVSSGTGDAGTSALPAGCRDYGASPGDPPGALVDASSPNAQGVDVSDAQGDVPWRALAGGGIRFAFARASEGTGIRDQHFAQNWAMMKACGIPRGAYHVFEPTEPADAQVDNFLSRLDGDYGELPAVLDIEISREQVAARSTPATFPSTADYTAALLQWLAAVEQKTGKKPLVYIQQWYWIDYLGKAPAFTNYPLWAAGAPFAAADGWDWSFWQHGEPATWDGRQWDRDEFHGSIADLKRAPAATGAGAQ